MQTTGWIYTQWFKRFYIPQVKWKRVRLIRDIKRRRKARVAFVVSSLSMWRSQTLYRLLTEDKRFETSIVLCPFSTFAESQKKSSLEEMEAFFNSQEIPYLRIDRITDPSSLFRDQIRPDIIFYPQQYYSLYGNGIDSELFDEKLTCYIPYGFNTFEQPWIFNQRFNNIAWRMYYSSPSDLECARKYSLNKGKNVRIVGNPAAELFLQTTVNGISRIERKEIIWAPHYSINTGGLLERGSFSIYHDLMLRLADKYKDSIRFVFKPHPKLLSTLYNHPDWGKEKADAYYAKWAKGPYTRLETGGYVDLFMNSDAMIHDSGSFTAEYLYAQKPVMFMTRDKFKVEEQLNPLGKAALNAHYIGGSADDIEAFINDVVIAGNDPLAPARKTVYDKYLLPPNGRSCAENIYHDLLLSLGFEK